MFSHKKYFFCKSNFIKSTNHFNIIFFFGIRFFYCGRAFNYEMTNDLNVFFTNYIECSIKTKIVFNLYVYIVPDNLMKLYSRVTVANV